MVVPKPPVALEHACSVIYDNALYVYQPGAFQRLALEEGAVWETLPMGESVDGGVCVGVTPNDSANAGLFIVGGKAQTANYKGLQKFTYATGKWESIQPSAPVTQDRVWHGATYINSTDTILVYAGNQDGAQHPSSQTFTIQASAPYGVQAFESVAPPTIAPILLPWSETQAVLVGGDETNTKVMLFSTSTSWTDSGASLAQGLAKNSSQVQAILVSGDDGCKNLYTFDMTITPNKVDRIVLLDSSGKPVVNSPIITTRDESLVEGRRQSVRQRRDLTLPHWPAYNNTLAPNVARTNYAVAQDPTGLIVFSGGNTNDVLCMFNGRKNSWVNASEKLAQQQIIAETASVTGLVASATTAVVTKTPTSSALSQATTSAAGNSHPINSNALLGIVLGAIVAALLILGLVLFIIRRKKRRQSYIEAGHMRRASGSPQDVKDVFAIANDSKLAGGLGHFRGHQPTESQGSHSSAAILLGRAGTKKDLRRKPSNESRRTSTSSIFNKNFKSTISKPIPQLTEHPALQPQSREEKGVSFAPDVTDPRPVQARPAQPRGQPTDRQNSTRRSSGWNRYWSGGSALNLLGFGNSQRTTVVSDRSSRYSENNNNPNRITQDSATVPAIHMANVVDGRERMKRVHSGSPVVSQYSSKNPLKEASSATIERPVSPDSLSGYSSGIPASVHDTWDPLSSKKPWGSDRAPGNAYTGGGGFYPGLSVAANPAVPQNSRLDPPLGGSKQPQLAMASTSSDMSWLNLGDFGRR